MSYWKNDEKIELSQTQVSIPSTNGRSYSGVAGQSGRRIDFEIPPSVKFMDGKNSYLNFDIKLGKGAVNTRLQLDPFIGGNSIIKNLRIYSGNRAVLLEEITEYNANVQVKYSYDQDESMRKMRALKEGCLITNVENRGTLGTSKSNNIDTRTNPYYKAGKTLEFLTAKCSLPIHSGLFGGNEKIWPNLMSNGLFIELDIEDPARFIKQLDSVNRHRRVKQNPVFHGIDDAGTALDISNASARTEIFLAKSNNMISVENCPFVVGEKVGICEIADPTRECSLRNASDGGDFYPAITDITIDGGYVKLTLETFYNSDNGTGIEATSNTFILFSAAMDTHRLAISDASQIIAKTTSYAATCEISNVELIVQQVNLDPRYEQGMMQKMREGGSIDIDIPSVTNYKHSLARTNRNATINLAVSNTRAKSSIIMITDANTYDSADLIGGLNTTYQEESNSMDGELHSIRTGQVGIIDNLTSYQFQIDDKLVPSRPINVSKINKGNSITAQPLIELEKSIVQAGMTPRSFVDYNRNYLIGRAYALNNGVANLNNKSNQLQLFYNEKNAETGVDIPPTKEKLVYAFVHHIRRITIRGESIFVSL